MELKKQNRVFFILMSIYKMVLRYRKPVTIRNYYPNHELEGHIFGLGRIGAGKSVSLKSIVEGYRDNLDYKIWDLYGGERNEGLYWTLPSQDKEYWEKLNLIGRFDEEGPKQYIINLLYPYFISKLPNKLPYKEGCVNSKVFTIPLKDVTIDDIKDVLGTISDTSEFIWSEIINKINKKDTCAVLDDLSKIFSGTNTLLYKNFIIPMLREKFLMNYDCSTNLDIKGEADNKEAITILCLDFVPEKFHLFIIDYIIRKMSELVDENKIKKKNIIFIREAATFFRTNDDSVMDDNLKIFRSKMSHYIRMGRRGQYFCLDCQSYSEVKGLVQGSEDYLIMFKTTSFRDKEEMTEVLRREKRMRPDQINDLSFLNKGECFISESGGRNVQKIRIILPRSAYWKKEYPNFYKSFWEKQGGEWKNINSIKEEINNIYISNQDRYAEEKEKKNKKNEVDTIDKKELKNEIPIVQIRKTFEPKSLLELYNEK